MALSFIAVIPQTNTPWGFSHSSSQKKTTHTSFSCLFSRPRNRFFHGHFSSSFPAKAVNSEVQLNELQDGNNGVSPSPTSSDCELEAWLEFGENVSGEWDGFGADFTKNGTPIELPESVVPEAFREWEVKVFDWQTQCPTLAAQELAILSYKNIKLLPTVGCEADAATRHSIDERDVGGINNSVSAFGYKQNGCYVSVWQVIDTGSHELLELEHCLVDPRDRESRVRVVQAVRVENGRFQLEGVTVFVEQWYGPFRNGDQLGGCSIRDSAFASTAALEASRVVGVWRGSSSSAIFNGSPVDIFLPLMSDRDRKSVREESDLVLLPKQLWCSIKESEDGDTCCEVGWLFKPGQAITSQCLFTSIAFLKQVSIASETLEVI